MPGQRPYLWLFLVVMLIAAVVYWWYADWWAYVGTGPDAWPKFVMPWWWQFGESVMVGMLSATPLVGLARLMGWAWSCLHRYLAGG